MHRLTFRSFVTATLTSLAACAPVPDDLLDEPDSLAAAYTGRAGDLRPTGLSARCVGGVVTIHGAITHGGALPVGASVARMTFDRAGGSVEVPVRPLARGASVPVTSSRGGLAPGRHRVSLLADARNQVREGSESNNLATATVVCQANAPAGVSHPDLRIEQLSARCDVGVNGFVITGAYLVANRGTALAPATWTREQMPPLPPNVVTPNPSGVSVVSTRPLLPGDTTLPQPLRGPYGPFPRGAYTIVVRANVQGAGALAAAPVAELDATNNTASTLVHCP